MKVAEIGKNGFNNTSFTLTNKALNMAMSVSRFINIQKLRCPMIHNYCYYTVADPGPLMLGVLDRWTPAVNVLQTLEHKSVSI